MAAKPALRMPVTVQTQWSRSLASSNKQLRQLHTGLRVTRPPASILPPTATRQFNRLIMSSPLRRSLEQDQDQTQPTVTRSISDEDWESLSNARKIQWLVGPDDDAKWGWVVYRCSYKPELDSYWRAFKRMVDERVRKEVAGSDAPGIADKMDWVFVEDPALEGASLDELKQRFRAWTKSEISGWDIENEQFDRGSRYTYFIQVDEEALRSLMTAGQDTVELYNGHVKIVRGWVDPLPPEEAAYMYGEDVDNEDWMRIRGTMLEPEFYVALDNSESWYQYYSWPSEGRTSGY